MTVRGQPGAYGGCDHYGDMTSSSAAKSVTPGYNHRMPDEIMTPDPVPTRLGTLTFVDGVPTAETARIALRQPGLPQGRGSVS